MSYKRNECFVNEKLLLFASLILLRVLYTKHHEEVSFFKSGASITIEIGNPCQRTPDLPPPVRPYILAVRD